MGWFTADGSYIPSATDDGLSPEPSVDHAREDLRTYSKSAFNLAYKKPVIAQLWVSVFGKTAADAKATTKDVMVTELINWVFIS